MEQRNAQHFAEQNTDKISLALENKQAWEPALFLNGKGKATGHAVSLSTLII
jgi:cytochrome c1